MPITAAQAAALKKTINDALNPPEPASLTPEQFGEYVSDLVAHAHDGSPELQQARVDALKAAETALKAAETAGAEVVELVRFDAEEFEKAKAGTKCPGCGGKMEAQSGGGMKCSECGGKFTPAKAQKGDETAPAPAPDPLAIAKANLERMQAEAHVLDLADGHSLTPEQKDIMYGGTDKGWAEGNLNDPAVQERINRKPAQA